MKIKVKSVFFVKELIIIFFAEILLEILTFIKIPLGIKALFLEII